MLQFYGYSDVEVVEELQHGFSLMGEITTTTMLPIKFSPGVLTKNSLELQSNLRRRKILSENGGFGYADVDLEIWKQTLLECEKGWLRGPLEESEFPTSAPISKRFGLRQKHKIRLIDDLSESAVNQAVAGHETPVLHTVDSVCALVFYTFTRAAELGLPTALFVRTLTWRALIGRSHSMRKGVVWPTSGFIIPTLASVGTIPGSCAPVRSSAKRPCPLETCQIYLVAWRSGMFHFMVFFL